jgi:hypothetical protein
MRLFAAGLLVALSACGGARDRGPAWPKSAGTVSPDDYKDDGGESLEPRPSHVAAIEVAPDETPSADVKAAAAPAADKGTATSPDTPPTPTTETIEIQIEDIQVGPGDIIINP